MAWRKNADKAVVLVACPSDTIYMCRECGEEHLNWGCPACGSGNLESACEERFAPMDYRSSCGNCGQPVLYRVEPRPE